VDGNFKADHIKSRRPDQDIRLTNGQGYMVEEDRYKEYLSVAKEPRVVCFNFIVFFYGFLTYLIRGLHVGNIRLLVAPTRKVEKI
jgi:hypothetical protein